VFVFYIVVSRYARVSAAFRCRR